MKAKYFICDCQCGVIAIDYYPDSGLELAFFERNASRSWRNRIRLAWKALCGRPYTDMVILNNAKVIDLIDQLTKIKNRKDFII